MPQRPLRPVWPRALLMGSSPLLELHPPRLKPGQAAVLAETAMLRQLQRKALVRQAWPGMSLG